MKRRLYHQILDYCNKRGAKITILTAKRVNRISNQFDTSLNWICDRLIPLGRVIPKKYITQNEKELISYFEKVKEALLSPSQELNIGDVYRLIAPKRINLKPSKEFDKTLAAWQQVKGVFNSEHLTRDVRARFAATAHLCNTTMEKLALVLKGFRIAFRELKKSEFGIERFAKAGNLLLDVQEIERLGITEEEIKEFILEVRLIAKLNFRIKWKDLSEVRSKGEPEMTNEGLSEVFRELALKTVEAALRPDVEEVKRDFREKYPNAAARLLSEEEEKRELYGEVTSKGVRDQIDAIREKLPAFEKPAEKVEKEAPAKKKTPKKKKAGKKKKKKR